LHKFDKEKDAIIWAADDPNLHSFPVNRRGNGSGDAAPPPVFQTVAEYFNSKHGVKLKYPKMPIILTREYGYYPIEFAFQAFEKVKGANSPEQCRDVLAFHDEFSGYKKIDHLTASISEMEKLVQYKTGQDLRVLASQFNFQINKDPVTVEATVLPEPSLNFGTANKSRVVNGSWNLADAKFKRYVSI
jgi:hypothetical protein